MWLPLEEGPLGVSRVSQQVLVKLGRKLAISLRYIYFSSLFFLRAGDKSPKASLR